MVERRSKTPVLDYSLDSVLDRLPNQFCELDIQEFKNIFEFLEQLTAWLREDQRLPANAWQLDPSEHEVLAAIGFNAKTAMRAALLLPYTSGPQRSDVSQSPEKALHE